MAVNEILLTAVSDRFSENNLEENHILERTDREKINRFWLNCWLLPSLWLLSRRQTRDTFGDDVG